VATLDPLDDDLQALEQAGRLRTLRRVNGVQDRLIDLDGRPVLNFSSNNYLGLAAHPALADAARRTVEATGLGAGASRLIVGNHAVHEELERELARFHDVEAALLFNSGYQANVGVIQALVADEDEVFSDELNHASIIDGCRLSKARVAVFPHGDLAALEGMLRTSRARRRLVVTDALFSMDGNRAALAELDRLCAARGAWLMVDEAHALGVVGPGGRGLSAEVGARPHVLVGTLGKAFGSFGAYVAGEHRLIRYLINRSRSFIFTTALPPAVAAASLAAVRLAAGAEGEARRRRLGDRIEQLRRELSAEGIPTRSDSQIQPIIIGEDGATMAASEGLLASGVFAQGIRPPTVPRGTSRLRVALMADHTASDVSTLVAALARTFHVERRRLEVGK